MVFYKYSFLVAFIPRHMMVEYCGFIFVICVNQIVVHPSVGPFILAVL